jgi:hypothetical protein
MTNEQRFYSLIELMDCANAACRDAVENKIDDAYLVHRVRPLEAREWTNETGGRGYSVIIGYAAPEATSLHHHIKSYLEKEGFRNVEITTEW